MYRVSSSRVRLCPAERGKRVRSELFLHSPSSGTGSARAQVTPEDREEAEALAAQRKAEEEAAAAEVSPIVVWGCVFLARFVVSMVL